MTANIFFFTIFYVLDKDNGAQKDLVIFEVEFPENSTWDKDWGRGDIFWVCYLGKTCMEGMETKQEIRKSWESMWFQVKCSFGFIHVMGVYGRGGWEPQRFWSIHHTTELCLDIIRGHRALVSPTTKVSHLQSSEVRG